MDKNDKTSADAKKETKKQVKKAVVTGAAEGIADNALREAEQAVLPTRAAVHQKAFDEARKIPLVGDAIDVAQKAGFVAHLGKLFKGRKDK